MLSFFQYLQDIYPLSPEAQAALMKVIKQKELRKGQVWLQEGAICDKISFVVKGMAKLYFEVGQKELILQLAGEGEFIVSAQSYFEQKPSAYSIRCIEPSTVVYFLFQDLQAILEKHLELNRHLIQIAYTQITKTEEHSGLLMLPPKDRFDSLLKNSLWQVNRHRLTDKLMAAYIGVTPASISYYRNGKVGKRP